MIYETAKLPLRNRTKKKLAFFTRFCVAPVQPTKKDKKNWAVACYRKKEMDQKKNWTKKRIFWEDAFASQSRGHTYEAVHNSFCHFLVTVKNLMVQLLFCPLYGTPCRS